MSDDPLSEDRFMRILARVTSEAGSAAGAARLCSTCADVTEMSGAGVMLLAGEMPQGSVCTSGDLSPLIEDLQYTFGEGPCVDAYRQRRPVIESDLANPIEPRWPAFTPSARDAGVGAVFGFPVTLSGVRFGALNLYRREPGPLTADQHADALIMATFAARAVMAMQADAPPGALGAELVAGGNFQAIVHQASGMIAVQLGVSVADALVRLRAHAFSKDRLVVEIARDVVDRRLRLVGDGRTKPRK